MVHRRVLISTVMTLLFLVSRVACRRIISPAAFQASARTTASRRAPSIFTKEDAEYMDIAIKHAKHGVGHTFPNPAVGCILVNSDSNEIVGQGFHPQAGFPHAEVFALLQASNLIATSSGVEAAQCIIEHNDKEELYKTVVDLTEQYASAPEKLFGGMFKEMPVTAYVTLEPCSHFGKTPPCAVSLVLAQVDRVVVGFRDPNPRVDGGGVRLLEQAGITVDFAEGKQAKACAKLVECFVKRISSPQTQEDNYQESITGAMRRTLRSLAGRLKNDNTLNVKTWPSSVKASNGGVDDDLMTLVDTLPLNPSWMEDVDACLWQKELVQLRLGNAVAKKKGAKRLGERIAGELGAHVAQVVGHTVLLYRPGIPPVLDLQQLAEERRSLSSTDGGE